MKIIEKIYDIATGEESIIEREETKAEAAERIANDSAREARLAAEATKKSLRESALQKLGLTAEEVDAIFG